MQRAVLVDLPRCEVDTVDELVPHAGLPAEDQLLLLLVPVEVQRFGQVELGPVAPVAEQREALMTSRVTRWPPFPNFQLHTFVLITKRRVR